MVKVKKRLCLEQKIGILLVVFNDLFKDYMATAKKTPAKKKTTVKKAPVKKATIKKKPAIKRAAASKNVQLRSFRVSPDVPSFNTFKITRQTVYWIILVSFIIYMQLWILKVQIETADYIEAQVTSLSQNKF